MSFAEIRIGRMFHCNGNDYVKQSSRTARMLSNGRVWYTMSEYKYILVENREEKK